MSRNFDPLKMTDDSILIDTTDLTESEAITKILSYIDDKLLLP